MGALFSLLKKKRDLRVLLLGLDNAGKTTIIKQLGLQKMYTKDQMAREDDEINVTDTVPTVGFTVKEIQYNNLKMVVWDLGGQKSIRGLWKHYFSGTDGLIYVIDSFDKDRLKETRQQFKKLLDEPELKDCCILIYANKNDIDGALNGSQLINKLKLEEILEGRKWYVQSCSAVNGTGIKKGMEWLGSSIK